MDALFFIKKYLRRSAGAMVCALVLLVSADGDPITAQQPEPALQTEIERLGAAVARPDGTWRGRLTIAARPNLGRAGFGPRRGYDLLWYQSGARRRLELRSRRRDIEAVVLFLPRGVSGSSIWLSDRPRNRLRKLRDDERFLRVLNTGFRFADLAEEGPGVLEALYRGAARQVLEPSQRLRLDLRPAIATRGGGGAPKLTPRATGRMVALLDAPENGRVMRRDFYSADRVLERSLFYYYNSPVLLRSTGQAAALERTATRLEMLDLTDEAISVIEFHRFDDTAALPDSLFDPARLAH